MFDKLMTTVAERYKITQLIGFYVSLYTEISKRTNVVYIQPPTYIRLAYAATFTGVIISFSGFAALFAPIWAAVFSFPNIERVVSTGVPTMVTSAATEFSILFHLLYGKFTTALLAFFRDWYGGIVEAKFATVSLLTGFFCIGWDFKRGRAEFTSFGDLYSPNLCPAFVGTFATTEDSLAFRRVKRGAALTASSGNHIDPLTRSVTFYHEGKVGSQETNLVEMGSYSIPIPALL